jgi:tetratricopeptide (TPR) repeat protein
MCFSSVYVPSGFPPDRPRGPAISVTFQFAEPPLHPNVEPGVTTDRAPDCSLTVSKIVMRVNSRRILLVPALALALGLASCHSSMEKADAWEAQYDRMMANQAYGPALMAIRKSISYDDTTARRYIKLAELQMQAGMTAGAASSFQAALDLEPDNIEALQNLAILAVRGGQFDAAQRYIDPLLSLNPNDPAGLLASGAIALNQHHFKDALALSDRIIAALPDQANGYVLKARALDGQGQTREAIAMLEKRAAVTEDPKELLIQLMTFYRRIRDPDDAALPRRSALRDRGGARLQRPGPAGQSQGYRRRPAAALPRQS